MKASKAPDYADRPPPSPSSSFLLSHLWSYSMLPVFVYLRLRLPEQIQRNPQDRQHCDISQVNSRAIGEGCALLYLC